MIISMVQIRLELDEKEDYIVVTLCKIKNNISKQEAIKQIIASFGESFMDDMHKELMAKNGKP